MTNTIIEYNDDSAFHYKSHRPPFHETLLSQILKDQKFKNVLDVGCGTGYDPSESMLKQSQKHPIVNYKKTKSINKRL